MVASIGLSDFGIPIRESSSRFWVVRASGGDYIPHFMKGGIAAIGHLDRIADVRRNPSSITQKELESHLFEAAAAKRQLDRKIRVANTKSQISTFIHEIKDGDTIVSLDGNHLAIGTASGPAFFSEERISIAFPDGMESHMGFKTRIPVSWKYRFNRRELPLVVRNSLQAHQTVFSLERHWTYIYHLVFPLFADSKHLYVSNYIHQKEDISSYAMSHLLSFYAELEPLIFGNSEEQVAAFQQLDFDKVIRLFRQQQSPRYMSFKTEVFSQGPVWWKLPLKWIKDYRRLILFIVVMNTLFGGELGFYTSPGLVTPEMREETLRFILKKIDEHGMRDTRNQLQLDIPRQFNNPIFDPSKIRDV